MNLKLEIDVNVGVAGPLIQYKSLVEQGKLQHDPYQESVASELEKLLARLTQYEKDMEEYHVKLELCILSIGSLSYSIFYMAKTEVIIFVGSTTDWLMNCSFFFFFLFNLRHLQVNLSKWEKNRENERRRLLLEEAGHQQQEDWWSKQRKLVQRWTSR